MCALWRGVVPLQDFLILYGSPCSACFSEFDRLSEGKGNILVMSSEGRIMSHHAPGDPAGFERGNAMAVVDAPQFEQHSTAENVEGRISQLQTQPAVTSEQTPRHPESLSAASSLTDDELC